MENNFKPKNFWRKPEGVTGALILGGIIVGGAYAVIKALPILVGLASNLIYLSGMFLVLGAIIYMVLDPKMRTLSWYMYKSAMRWITSLFVKIDPIGILKSYAEDLKDNLGKMNKQITKLRSQMHLLKEQIHNNKKQINESLNLAEEAKQGNKHSVLVLKSRQAGRLKESNFKLEDLYRKMNILYRVLARMYENSEVISEDIIDEIKIKEQERKAIHASHSAMKSAMSIISGDKDKRALFDESLEALADDISGKVGEMEQFMELSENFMSSVDLQNGVFEEEGIKMLEKWETEGISKILGKEKQVLVANDPILLIEDKRQAIENTPQPASRNEYEDLFNK
jgi:phage shock protein A